MARIAVLGGTGYGGAAVAAEAVKRGHDVTSYSRRAPEHPIDGVSYVTGNLLDPELLLSAVDGADIVFEKLSPRGDMEGKLEGLVEQLISLTNDAAVRLAVLGGASSLLVAEGGPRVFDLGNTPPEVVAEAQTGINLLELLRQAPESLDWFYVSPPLRFGSWEPQHVTGNYRVSDDVLLKDDTGESYISAADLAIAVVDEFEQPRHSRRRFHVAH
ncbi:MAG: NAD(P)-dependent oxidoreductase [Actinomycetes bacterium]